MSEEETKEEVKEETKSAGRKPGSMKRDEQGRLLKKDGTLAKTPGRKKEPESNETKKRGRPTKTTSNVKTEKDLKAIFKKFQEESKELIKNFEKDLQKELNQ